jgi:hypothetical protein
LAIKDLGPDERLQALERVLQSRAFTNCDAVRHILQFIVEKSIAGKIDEIKEYTIATEVLGRPQGFNPRNDNIIRVQVHRLRKKLEEYYSQEGRDDPVRIFVPLGHYYPEYVKLPVSSHLTGERSANATGAAATKVKPSGPSSLNWQRVALGLLLLNLGLSGLLLFRPSSNATLKTDQSQLSRPLTSLWHPFLTTGQPPLIVYSNALFLMSEQGDLYRYYTDTSHSLAMGAQVPSLAGLERRGPVPDRVGQLYYFDSYTGIGEVVATGRIAQLLSRAGQEFLVKRSRIASYEDVRNRNVVFLGASLEDSMLGKLPVDSDLVFEEPKGGEFVGRLLIRDRHPEEGAPSMYEFKRDERTKALQSEYALISLLPSVSPNHYILVLAGLSTLGTQAAAEFAASEESMLTLEKLRPASLDNDVRSSYFQALLEVQIRDGIAVKTNCLFVRELHRN